MSNPAVKRALDISAALFGLIITFPVIAIFALLVFFQDCKNPLYLAPRVGRGRRPFKMVKLRSMVINADKSGVDSTSSNDPRITPIGQIIRRYKLDELCQLWNVLWGDMSLVGPRPNVERNGVELYTPEEMQLLSVRPGITDLASIIFADEGEILKQSNNPDLDYNRLIRPWKSRLGLLYVQNISIALDLQLICLTLVALFSRSSARVSIEKILRRIGAEQRLIDVCMRDKPLYPFPPPGAVIEN